ncbi:MAG: aldehyde dehydrogenase family protein [Anaerolineales bacterium]|nr:aldehyde dehydrogenase family protein [Anaerolineales bacterium]
MIHIQSDAPYHHYIDGRWLESASGRTFQTHNPSTEEPIATVARGGVADVEHAVVAARRALAGPWGRWTPRERGRFLHRVAAAIRLHAADLAYLETIDNGKPLAQARKEVEGAARYFEFYAGAADKIHGEQIPLGPGTLDFTIREPMGVTAHIIPWNKPLNILCRGLAPALAAGNTAVLKPSELTPLTALQLAAILDDLGLPPGVVNVVTGFGEEAGAALAGHTSIDHLTFTGTLQTGRTVMKAAAEHIKPLVLELGGKSPLIVFADADLDLAADEAVRGIITNCGQMCSAGSRILVEAGAKAAFLDRLLPRLQRLRIGPGIENPDVGPLVSSMQFDRVAGHIEIAQSEGAAMILGGARPDHLPYGYFIRPTLFDDVLPDMYIAQQEVFGPVLAVLTFADEAEALALANQGRFGLVAGIFTRQASRALRLATRMRAGQVFINGYYTGDEEMPFGGYRDSGFGREKGLAALHTYTQLKNVAIRF